MSLTVKLSNTALIAALTVALSGCAQNYLQNGDTVSSSAGNAVQANLARETIDPSKRSMNDTTGLGSNGNQLPPSVTP